MYHSENVYLSTNENLKFNPLPSRDFRFINDIKSRFPLHNYKRLGKIISELRCRKEPEEIELMKKACALTNKAFHRVLKFVKPGVNEYEIEAEIIHEFLRNGANGHAYPPIVASGKNACILHYPDNDKKCKDGDLVLMDFGADYANYSADTTRTIPVNGKFSPRQREIYEAVLRVLRKAISLMIAGKTINSFNKEVNKIMENELIGLSLFTKEDVEKQDADNPMYFKYFMHGTSHFIGLDVHDTGTKDTVFEPGMVLSCEPGIYIEEENIGIRLENDILITEGKPVDLLKDEPLEPDEIEQLMAERE
jgi:Xaa-Pro aminopeptidase